MINDFVKNMRKLFGDVEFKATSNDGETYKTRGFDKREKDNSNKKRKEQGSDIATW